MSERVWISPTGNCYHRTRDCLLVKWFLRERLILVGLEQAQRLDRGPCVGRLCWRDGR